MKYPRSCSSATSCSSYTICAARTSSNYVRIKHGLRRSNPAAIVLWAFHRIPSTEGLTSRRVINFLKQYFKVLDDPRRTGKSLGNILRCAVEFGLLEKRNNRYFLAHRKR